MSDTVLEFAAIFTRWEDGVEEACEQWVTATLADAMKLVLERWPDVGDDHPYATGRSKKEFKIEMESALRGYVSNAASRQGRIYPGYTEEGYTRQGPYTAKPYFGAGEQEGEGYAARVLAENKKRWVEDLKKRVERVLNV